MLLQTISQHNKTPIKSIIFYGVLSGASSSLMLALLNNAANDLVAGQANIIGFGLFFITLLLSSLTKRVSLNQTQAIIQDILRGIRIRITDRIRKSNLVTFEAKGKEVYFVALTQQTNQISNASLSLINASQSLVIIVACILYIGWISPLSLAVIFLFILFGVLIYQMKDAAFQDQIIETVLREKDFFALLNHILSGFKELVLSREKRDHIYRDFHRTADQATDLKINTATNLSETVMFSQAYMYGLIALLIIVFPYFGLTEQDKVPKLVVAILFFWTSLEGVVAAIPDYARANTALMQLHQLEQELGDTHDEQVPAPLDFQRSIRFDGLQYRHCDEYGLPLFEIGPTDFSIHKGEILFICGGNGSGKTTLMKAMCGLYPTQDGTICVDGTPLGTDQTPAYRQLFSAVFPDFHLFDRFYGLKDLKGDRVNALLRKLELHERTSFNGFGFTKTDLSAGQKKRLALISALLEDRPICLFDEPAAELDPAFRAYFYEDFLPELRAEGRTVVVITHDDRYFTCCDRLIRMENGKITGIECHDAV